MPKEPNSSASGSSPLTLGGLMLKLVERTLAEKNHEHRGYTAHEGQKIARPDR
ncbi:MAG: hypothetical protein ACYC6G_19515 [Desulfobaccales bacterium]